MALKPENPVVGGTVLRRQAIESPNYVPGVAGWVIKQDGSAEFNNLTLRGTFNGTDYVINSTGAFFYSGPPAAGNLVSSITNFSGTDPFGNIYLDGIASYGNISGQAVASFLGVVFLYTGSLAGGWTQQASIQADTGTPGQTDISGPLSVNGSTSTGVGDNGGVTSGPSGTVSSFPAAGPNHTHNETHHHPL